MAPVSFCSPLHSTSLSCCPCVCFFLFFSSGPPCSFVCLCPCWCKTILSPFWTGLFICHKNNLKNIFFPTSLSWSDTFTKSWQLFSVAFIKSVCWYNENHSHKVQCFMCSSRDFYYKMRSKILRNEQIIFMSTLCGNT